MVNLLCRGSLLVIKHFLILRPNTEVLISWTFSTLLIEPRKDVSEGRPEDVGRTRPLMLNIRPHRDVLITSAGGVLKTSVGDVPWYYI